MQVSDFPDLGPGDEEPEAFRRQRSRIVARGVRPSLIGVRGDRGVEEEQKLLFNPYDEPKAEEVLEEQEEIDPEETRRLARKALRDGEVLLAEKLYTELVEKRPKDVQALRGGHGSGAN